ncbi:sugar ABC transporter permease [Litorilinea aerophila]|uniref:Sugar ABC transporter permease n=1 Tax=Litorilinea aerophila TaxID=1204385 RepID=A0A540V9C7_9CHLR|nr:sugar ABC transporter permease [Litorilinea aerophila]MCC9078745.1 sugar ABC transporter permease [Litorilinea aerophila]GIV78793.1 MAG: glycerol-3-phosphate ABC transporter permease [Litorilinea sp.]
MSTTLSRPSSGPPSGAPHRGTWRTRRWVLGNYLFILPFMLLFCTFTLAPILYSFYMSLHDWKMLAPERPFTGLRNFQLLLRDDIWWIALRNSLYFAFLTAIINTFFALVVAIGANQPIRGRDFFRFIYYAPVILSVSAMGIIMSWMMNTQFGVINYFLVWFGLPPVKWLADTRLVIPSLSLATVWWGFGFPMLIYIAGLQGIPAHLYEAARIDGASGWRLTWHITLPLMRPTIFFVAVTQLIAHFQVFGQPYIMTGGGPGRASFTTIMYLYQTAWRFFRMGYGTTIAIGLALVILFFTLLQFRFFGRQSIVEY